MFSFPILGLIVHLILPSEHDLMRLGLKFGVKRKSGRPFDAWPYLYYIILHIILYYITYYIYIILLHYINIYIFIYLFTHSFIYLFIIIFFKDAFLCLCFVCVFLFCLCDSLMFLFSMIGLSFHQCLYSGLCLSMLVTKCYDFISKFSETYSLILVYKIKFEQEFLKAETRFFSENWHLSLCNIIECYFNLYLVQGYFCLIDWLIENFWISLDMKIVWWCSACPCIVCVWDFPSQDVGCCLTMCPMVVTCNMA